MLLRKPKKRRSGPNEWKQYGYEHDSISPDAYCMYERAAKLAGMAGSDNPFFSSVDTWSFGASLERAKTYYRLRYQTEAPNGQSVDELSNSALRKRFYAYAQETVGRGYVHETESSFDAFFPRLPKNTDEMRSTILYTEAVYPKTIDAQGLSVLPCLERVPGSCSGLEWGWFNTGNGCRRILRTLPLLQIRSKQHGKGCRGVFVDPKRF